jgi:4a-hydroxytetrahydrobiopterin dehydratase
MSIADKLCRSQCKPCEGGVPVLSRKQSESFCEAIPQWSISEDATMITRQVNCKNFVRAIELVNEIAAVAEAEQHHPDLHLTGYRNLRIDLTTHAIGGLSENDFIVAAKIDRLL